MKKIAPKALTMHELIKMIAIQNINQIHTSLPCTVVKYDATTRLATLQPPMLLQTTDENELPIQYPHPMLLQVPVIFPGAGMNTIEWAIMPGDEVVVFFSEASITNFMLQGGVTEVSNKNKFNINDAYCIPGIRSQSKVSQATPTNDGITITNSQSGNSIKIDSTGTVMITGDLHVTGDIFTTAKPGGYNKHQHEQQPITMAAPGTVVPQGPSNPPMV